MAALESTKGSVLVTGGAGFIGGHVAEALLKRGDRVVIADEVNDYYDVSLKRATLARLQAAYGDRVKVYEGDLCDAAFVDRLYDENGGGGGLRRVVHLAARAGVRPSIDDPFVYIHSNLEATTRLLEAARRRGCDHFVYASSSSVYGERQATGAAASGVSSGGASSSSSRTSTSTSGGSSGGSTDDSSAFSEEDAVERPVSPYAATKKMCELTAHTYHHLYKIPVAGLRFFTVYGPRGRPDMAPFKFVDRVSRGLEIQQFGDGTSSRDYTYIDDIVDGVVRCLDTPRGYEVYNLGNGDPIALTAFIRLVEKCTGKAARIDRQPMQPGDVPRTCANIAKARRLLGYTPKTPFEEGIAKTVKWYREEYAASRSKARLSESEQDAGPTEECIPRSERVTASDVTGAAEGERARRWALPSGLPEEARRLLESLDLEPTTSSQRATLERVSSGNQMSHVLGGAYALDDGTAPPSAASTAGAPTAPASSASSAASAALALSNAALNASTWAHPGDTAAALDARPSLDPGLFFDAAQQDDDNSSGE